MKKLLTLALLLLLTSFSVFAQDEIEYKRYSYADFFQMIEDEEDTIFRLENALIKYDSLTDDRFLLSVQQVRDERGNYYNKVSKPSTDSLFVTIPLVLNNVQFLAFGGPQIGTSENSNYAILYLVSFEEQVTFTDSSIIFFLNCHFKKNVNFKNTNKFAQIVTHLDRITVEKMGEINIQGTTLPMTWTEDGIQVDKSTFNQELSINLDGSGGEKLNQRLSLNELNIRERLTVFLRNIRTFNLRKSEHVNQESKLSNISLTSIPSWSVTDNTFGGPINLSINTNNEKSAGKILGNSFTKAVSINSTYENRSFNLKKDFIFNSDWEIDWEQWSNKVVTRYGKTLYNDALGSAYLNENPSLDRYDLFDPTYMDQTEASFDVEEYKKEIAYNIPLAYQFEREMRIVTLKHYREQMDQVNANLVYVELKDLETIHLGALYSKDPNFENFFTWKINKFLKIFSAYGTRPAKAIVFSLYVILAFALIYLFFPNHWDSHGKNRLKDRFGFFYKYMSLNAGIQDVYLEENKAEIEDNQTFKALLVAHKEQAPKMFFNLAMPLYRWSVAGTVTYAWLIKRFDFLKGTWQDADPKTHRLKSFLIGTMFIVALTYDIFIKMLNALMLSINTFTTLGFGEIPIKGLPRYLAIIQGFIGWFMLTIFSVSLISQLLN